MSKHRIAIAVAALFLGAQAGIAALEPEATRSPESEAAAAATEAAEQHAADYQAATAEIADRTESSAAAEQPDAVETSEAVEQPAGTVTTDAAAHPAEAAGPAPAAAQTAAAPQQPTAANSAAAPEQPATWWDKVRAAFASFFEQVRVVLASATPAPTFPDGDGSSAWHLPATIAYLEQVERERAAAIQTAAAEPAYPDEAGGPIAQFAREIARAAQSQSAFPMGADESTWREPMPAELAYFEQLERERLAKETALRTAQAEAATVR